MDQELLKVFKVLVTKLDGDVEEFKKENSIDQRRSALQNIIASPTALTIATNALNMQMVARGAEFGKAPYVFSEQQVLELVKNVMLNYN